jgi:2-methylcitrate dehydratase
MTSNIRPAPDAELIDIAEYVSSYSVRTAEALDTAALCMTDTLAGALDAVDFPDCTKMVGPVVPGTVVPHGSRIPGTHYELDPENAAFGFGCLIRWLDFNDQFNAARNSHPSDNLAGILTLADHLSRKRIAEGGAPLLVRDVLVYLIKAYEITGCIGLENAIGDDHGIDQNLLTRVASSAVLTHMLGGSHEQIVNAVSNAFIDVSLAVYRRAPNTGSRKSWACADSIMQAMRLARMSVAGEMGYPSVLTTRKYGFYDARNDGQPFKFQRHYGEYIIGQSNFKFVAAGAHSQTAVEAAFRLHSMVKDRLEEIESIIVRGHRAFMGVMHKTGPLHNPADRDHCAEYIIAVGLIHGTISPPDYEDHFAADPRIDRLRDRMDVAEEARYTNDYYDPEKRSSASSLQVRFKDGSATPKIEIEYPAGHSRRRAEVQPILRAKFMASLDRRFAPAQKESIAKLCNDRTALYATPVHKFVDLLVTGLSMPKDQAPHERRVEK